MMSSADPSSAGSASLLEPASSRYVRSASSSVRPCSLCRMASPSPISAANVGPCMLACMFPSSSVVTQSHAG